MNWTQPICEECFQKRRPGVQPVGTGRALPETCCECGRETREGVYMRLDPRTVPFPRDEGD